MTRQQLRLELTLETMDQGITMVDANLNLVVMNDRFRELLEFPDDVIKPGVSLSEKRFVSMPSAVNTARATPKNRLPSAWHCPENLKRIASPVRDLTAQSWKFAVSPSHQVDLSPLIPTNTERVRAEEEARTAHNQLIDAIAVMDEGFVYFDAEDRLVLSNDKYREF